ncbi:TRL domain-containing protein [Leptospira sp. 'Mane']|uniref:TRL domain-containing protein n=1 Tax=Leptospira sp. 'Mane' TaxID=3387407 RepID=UPI00398AFAD6
MKFCLSLFSVLFVGCISIQQGNPSLTLLYNRGTNSFAGTSISPKEGFMVGESCITSYFGLFSWGDASAESAARMAKLKEIYSINHVTKTQYLFLQEFCTVLLGK